MEETAEQLRLVNEEVKESKAIFQSLNNEIRALHDLTAPLLQAEIAGMRNARMATTQEATVLLRELREVRKFFLESDYSVEVERLERFVSLCHQLAKLKADGTLDAVADIAIRLAVKESI